MEFSILALFLNAEGGELKVLNFDSIQTLERFLGFPSCARQFVEVHGLCVHHTVFMLCLRSRVLLVIVTAQTHPSRYCLLWPVTYSR